MTFKEFWSNKSTLINVGIFVTILISMAVIALVIVLSSCNQSGAWLKDPLPTVRTYSVSKVGPFKKAWFTISNPTTSNTKGYLTCRSNQPVDKREVLVYLPKMSNTKHGIILPVGSYECYFSYSSKHE